MYKTITEFVADMRLLLENCYRFNGPDHNVSRKAQRIETLLEQKLALLSRFSLLSFCTAFTSWQENLQELHLCVGRCRKISRYLIVKFSVIRLHYYTVVVTLYQLKS